MILLDTNVLSELMKPNPAERVLHWVDAQSLASLCTSSITMAEILHGIMLLPAGKRRNAIESAAAAMFEQDFSGRILPFGSDAAPLYAQLAIERRKAGRPISHFDAQIAAIALLNKAAIATRNVADFEGCGVKVIDPWGGQAR